MIKENNKNISYILTYSSALRPSESLGLFNNGRPYFPIDCLLSPSLNLISHRALSASSNHLSLGLPLLLLSSGLLQNTFVTVLSRSIFATCPIHSNLFFLISAPMSRSLYSSLNSWLILILCVPCFTSGPGILLNISLSPCTQSFHIHLSHSPCITPKHYNRFHHHFVYLIWTVYSWL